METNETIIQIKTLEGQPYEIQEEGSLGLLALGYKGLVAWREKRILIQQAKNESKLQQQ